MAERIEDYFLIGDLHTAALVSQRGSIDWLCLPHFDSPSIFARLLDPQAGCFRLEAGDFESEASYRPGTAIVDITFKRGKDSYLLSDLMLPRPIKEAPTHYLVRRFKGLSGRSQVKFTFEPRPDYGRQQVQLELKTGVITARVGKYTLWLRLPETATAKLNKGAVQISFDLHSGENKTLVMAWSRLQAPHYAQHEFEAETERFWSGWLARGKFFDFCSAGLKRSAITLKLMQFYPTGGIVAAPTTSLPESLGGERNWDYRYVWMRDATFTLYALYVLGFIEEAERFFQFVERVARRLEDGGRDLDIFYTIHGQIVPDEQTLENMQGYADSRPVRLGNAAKQQVQLDVYGSVIDAYYFMSQRDLVLSDDAKQVVLDLIEQIRRRWQQPDSGIWEVRSGKKHFSYSKVMAWAGVDRALRLSPVLGIKADDQQKLRQLEIQIRDWIWHHCYDEARGTFKQQPETQAQDATNLFFIPLRFLNRHNAVTRSVVEATQSELGRGPLVDRYHATDGLDGTEGAFVLCTFWLISALAMTRQTGAGLRLFREFEKYTAASGLLSEEIDKETGAYLGNFPQAYSHVGYIMAAYYLQRYGAVD